MLQEERDLETIPVGALGIIPLKGCEQLSLKELSTNLSADMICTF